MRRGEQVERMLDRHGEAARDRAGADLEQAAGIRGRDHLGAAGRDVIELPREQARRHRRLGQVVGAGAAAAEVGLVELDEPDARNRRRAGGAPASRTPWPCAR